MCKYWILKKTMVNLKIGFIVWICNELIVFNYLTHSKFY